MWPAWFIELLASFLKWIKPAFSLDPVQFVSAPNPGTDMFGFGFQSSANWVPGKTVWCGFGSVTIQQTNPSGWAKGTKAELRVTHTHWNDPNSFSALSIYQLTFPTDASVTFSKIAIGSASGDADHPQQWNALKQQAGGTPVIVELWYNKKKVATRTCTYFAGGSVVTCP